MTIAPAPEWEELRDILAREQATALLLGATDTGKSTLARYLVTALSPHAPVALVDADVGQSALCLPGTVGMRLFTPQTDVPDYGCESFVFLGSANPAAIAPRLVESASRLAAACRERGALVLVDTTGLIGGELGVGLKLAKIRAVAAAHVVAIQREEECEPILSRLDGVAIHRLTPSPLARTRTPEARSRARQDKLAAYFAAAGDAEHILETDKVALFRLNQPASLVHQELSPGTVLGLCHHDETLGLGLATEADKRSITLRTPLKSLKGVNRALFGDIVLGKE